MAAATAISKATTSTANERGASQEAGCSHWTDERGPQADVVLEELTGFRNEGSSMQTGTRRSRKDEPVVSLPNYSQVCLFIEYFSTSSYSLPGHA